VDGPRRRPLTAGGFPAARVGEEAGRRHGADGVPGWSLLDGKQRSPGSSGRLQPRQINARMQVGGAMRRRRRTTSPPDRSAITGACYVGMPTGHKKSVGKRGHQSITKLILYHRLESKACFSLPTWKLSLPILFKNKTRLGIVFNRDENGRRKDFHFHIFSSETKTYHIIGRKTASVLW
jgi:hypothetical protein